MRVRVCVCYVCLCVCVSSLLQTLSGAYAAVLVNVSSKKLDPLPVVRVRG